MTQSIKTLIERLEKASGPDLELDFDIAVQTGWKIADDCVFADYAKQYPKLARKDNFPRFTASIDSALTLIPVEPMNEPSGRWDWQVESTNGGLTVSARVGPEILAFADTPAIALCIAALKSREAQT